MFTLSGIQTKGWYCCNISSNGNILDALRFYTFQISESCSRFYNKVLAALNKLLVKDEYLWHFKDMLPSKLIFYL